MKRLIKLALLLFPLWASAQGVGRQSSFILKAPGLFTGGASPVQGSTLGHLRLVTGTGIEAGASFTINQTGGGDANTVAVGMIGQAQASGGLFNHLVGVWGWSNTQIGDPVGDRRSVEGRCDIRNAGVGGVCMGLLGLTYQESTNNTGQLNYGVVGQALTLTGVGTGINVGAKFMATGGASNYNLIVGDGTTSGDTEALTLFQSYSARKAGQMIASLTLSSTFNGLYWDLTDAGIDGMDIRLRDTGGASALNVWNSSFGTAFKADSGGNVTAGASITIGTGTKITGSVRCTGTLGTSALATSTTATQNITCTGAAVGAECIVGGSSTLEAGLIQTCYVSATNTITLRTHNGTAGSITPAGSQTVSVRVFNP